MPSPDEIRTLEPVLLEAVDGAWIAVAPEGSPVRVGAMEETADEARSGFRAAVGRLADALVS